MKVSFTMHRGWCNVVLVPKYIPPWRYNICHCRAPTFVNFDKGNASLEWRIWMLIIVHENAWKWMFINGIHVTFQGNICQLLWMHIQYIHRTCFAKLILWMECINGRIWDTIICSNINLWRSKYMYKKENETRHWQPKEKSTPIQAGHASFWISECPSCWSWLMRSIRVYSLFQHDDQLTGQPVCFGRFLIERSCGSVLLLSYSKLDLPFLCFIVRHL